MAYDVAGGLFARKSRQNRTSDMLRLVRNFLIPALGNLTLSRLGPSNLQEAYNRWSTSGRRDGKAGGLSPLTRRYIHSVVLIGPWSRGRTAAAFRAIRLMRLRSVFRELNAAK